MPPSKHGPDNGGTGLKAIGRHVEESLTRLGTDHLDLYWQHNWDRHTPLDETMSTVDDLVRQGKVRYVGLSDTPAWAVARMATPGRARWSDLNVPLPFLRDLGVPAQQGATTVNGVRA